jgi:hypothetical protein
MSQFSRSYHTVFWVAKVIVELRLHCRILASRSDFFDPVSLNMANGRSVSGEAHHSDGKNDQARNGCFLPEMVFVDEVENRNDD